MRSIRWASGKLLKYCTIALICVALFYPSVVLLRNETAKQVSPIGVAVVQSDRTWTFSCVKEVPCMSISPEDGEELLVKRLELHYPRVIRNIEHNGAVRITKFYREE